MTRPIILFTDFGLAGPYVGQVEMVLRRHSPAAAVINLMADAPACDPRAAAYVLAALLPETPPDAVVLAVVDPGVGSARLAIAADVDGRLLVGPDNGLFEPSLRRAAAVRAWEITWRPQRLSATFHGRDLFAPVAAGFAGGMAPETLGLLEIAPPRRPDWPDDLAEIVYADHYGNAWTGLRAATLPQDCAIDVGGRVLKRARTFADVAAGDMFWYENSCGLAEIAVNGGRADRLLGIGPGTVVIVR
jgi:S-adenosylmethionine hydrolase